MPSRPTGLGGLKRSFSAIDFFAPFTTSFFHSGVFVLSLALGGEALLDLRKTEPSLTTEPADVADERVWACLWELGFEREVIEEE